MDEKRKYESSKREARKRKQTFETLKTPHREEVEFLNQSSRRQNRSTTRKMADALGRLEAPCSAKFDSSKSTTIQKVKASSTTGREEPLLKPCFVKLDSNEVARYLSKHNIVMLSRESRLRDTKSRERVDQDTYKTRKLDVRISVNQDTHQSEIVVKYESVKIGSDIKSTSPSSVIENVDVKKDFSDLKNADLENTCEKLESTILDNIKQEPEILDPDVPNEKVIDISSVKEEDIEIGPTQYYNEDDKVFQNVDDLPREKIQVNFDPQNLDSSHQNTNLQNGNHSSNVQKIQLMLVDNKVLLVTSLNNSAGQKTQTNLAISDITSLFQSNSSTNIGNSSSIPRSLNSHTPMATQRNLPLFRCISSSSTPTINQNSSFRVSAGSSLLRVRNSAVVHTPTSSESTPTNSSSVVHNSTSSTPMNNQNSSAVVPNSTLSKSTPMISSSAVHNSTSSTPTNNQNSSPVPNSTSSINFTQTKNHNSSTVAQNSTLCQPTLTNSTCSSVLLDYSVSVKPKPTTHPSTPSLNPCTSAIDTQEKIDYFYNHVCQYHVKHNESPEPSLHRSNLVQIVDEAYEGALRCYQCVAHFSEGSSFIQHFTQAHRLKRGPNLCCKLCKICHRDAPKIQCHLMHSHSHYWNQCVGERTLYRCIVCESLFQNPKEQFMILKNMHLIRLNLPKKSGFGFMYQISCDSVPPPKTFSCLLCKVPSYYETELKFDEHFKTHCNDYVFKVCQKCQTVCHNINDYYYHHKECIPSVDIKTEEEWDMCFDSREWFAESSIFVAEDKKECLECFELFTNYCSFKMHMIERHGFKLAVQYRSVLNERNNMCIACKVVFKDVKLFLAHCVPFSVLSTTIPRYCHECNIVYSSTKLYEEHAQSTHSTQHCNVCNEEFKTSQTLDEHVCTEHNVQMVHCVWCSTDVKMNSNHFKSCSPTILACPICGFVCQSLELLLEHIQIDMNLYSLYQFQCKHCLNYFFTEFNLCAHIYNSKCSSK